MSKVDELKSKNENLFERNTILLNENERLKKENAELKEELKNWKDEWQEQVQKAIDEGYARTLQTIQLTKAKEIIRTFLNMPMPNNEEVFADVGMFLTKAEQFLKEIEK